ncbi:hypothetical protein PPYR_00677 [Photinus pyralis]|uniref:DDE Tnp4 domain-containing protein n=2 Tax=Photinus pyralis TaxID=7054 RepID=A0A5N4B284_PHOPY|nr:hypothetical protein PPYR_00677 [Photinus pyralis]
MHEREYDDLLMLYGLYSILKLRKKRKKKRIWVRKFLSKRDKVSHTTTILPELEADDFRNYLRMDEDTYTHLLSLVSARIQKCDTQLRKAITAHERLTATLRFLATGRNYTDLKFTCGISQPSLSIIIPETCEAICSVLLKDVIKFPKTTEEWASVASLYEDRWNFPNCLGSIDGKHVRITPPKNSGAFYRNYKGYDSLVLLAVVDADYKFLMVDFGTNGRVSDGGVIENTKFYKKLIDGKLNLPNCRRVGNRDLKYVFVGDEAFALKSNFMKPFNVRELSTEKRIYNYRLSRARRVVENVFGILASRFRIFHTAINLDLNNIEKVVMASCVLHNFLRSRSGCQYLPRDAIYSEDTENGTTRTGLVADDSNLANLQSGPNRNPSTEAKEVRDNFVQYFNNEGAVHFQNKFT